MFTNNKLKSSSNFKQKEKNTSVFQTQKMKCNVETFWFNHSINHKHICQARVFISETLCAVRLYANSALILPRDATRHERAQTPVILHLYTLYTDNEWIMFIILILWDPILVDCYVWKIKCLICWYKVAADVTVISIGIVKIICAWGKNSRKRL